MKNNDSILFNVVKNLKLIFFLLIILQKGYSQEGSENVIFLDEVVISSEGLSCKNVKTKGKKNTSLSVYNKSEFVSLIENIPNGQISFVKLFFNKNKKGNYQKTNFSLIVYSEENGRPKNKIINTKIRFNISSQKEHITLDLKELNLYNFNKIFIGVELLNNNESAFLMDSKILKNEEKTFYKPIGKNDWFVVPDINIKMELGVDCYL